ncbi:MAG: imidazole glycerol phosphate synthase subunit HisH [Anaerolineales bacterium]|nr:imidazole glycerol phosphate synthase subunit HisH [Anaerolineales bacterium]
MIVVVDYGVGNLGSIVNMFKKVGAKAVASSDPSVIKDAEKIILPGVGAFDAAMRKFHETGLVSVVGELVLEKKIPVLGLCVGLQLMTNGSEEGQLAGLGWFDAETIRFKFNSEFASLKVPHMGWNQANVCREHPLVAHWDEESRFYFVHSYHVVAKDMDAVLAKTDYGVIIHSILGKGNIMGVQFHPEKSHRYGMRLLKNFAENIQ